MKFIAIDGALANVGLAVGRLRLPKTKQPLRNLIDFSYLKLIQTEKQRGIVALDDDRRIRHISENLLLPLREADLIFAELVGGGRSARTALAFGATLGILRGMATAYQKPIIWVTPKQVKSITGKPKANKKQMISWAYKRYSNLPGWIYDKKIKGRITNTNEHLADAIAIAYAGTNKVLNMGLKKAIS